MCEPKCKTQVPAVRGPVGCCAEEKSMLTIESNWYRFPSHRLSGDDQLPKRANNAQIKEQSIPYEGNSTVIKNLAEFFTSH